MFRGRTDPLLTGSPISRTRSLSVVIAVLYEWARGLPQPKPLSGISGEEEDEGEVHRKPQRNLEGRMGVPHRRYSQRPVATGPISPLLFREFVCPVSKYCV